MPDSLIISFVTWPILPTREAGGSIKLGVERSGTPGQ